MNKKAMLLAEETLKIVLALIAIGFLVYFLVSLWMTNQNTKDLELAKASLQHLIDEINAGSSEVDIYNPSNPWIIVAWPVEGETPRQCLNLNWDNCLCICKRSWIPSFVKPSNTKEECDGNGVCKEIFNKIIISNKENFYIPIDKPPIKLNIVDNKITQK